MSSDRGFLQDVGLADLPFPTPVSNEKCLVRYQCTYTASAGAGGSDPSVKFGIQIPVVTTYLGSGVDRPGGLFGQISVVSIETQSQGEIFPEELVENVKNALSR